MCTLAEAMARGLFHPNCRHSISAYLPGVTHLPSGDLEDAEGYEARQQQRAIERRIRQWKEQQAAALDDAGRQLAAKRVRAAQADLREHLAQNPALKRLRYREQIGAGNVPPRGVRHHDASGPLGPDVQLDTEGGGDIVRRQLAREHRSAGMPARSPGDGQGTLDDPRNLSDEQLDAATVDAMSRGDWQAADGLAVELDRRDEARRLAAEAAEAKQQRLAEQRARRAEQQATRERAQYEHLQQLLDAGMSEEDAIAEALGISVERQRRDRAIAALRGEGRAGRSFDKLARQSYRDYLYRAWLQAEAATNGYLLNREGRAKNVDPRSLFSGPEARARRYASDELLAWWDAHGRPTFADWKAHLLDERGAERGGDSDWLR
jgi:hypothetical protein